MTIRRGDILWADLGMFPTTSVQGGVRPVIVVSNNKANRHFGVPLPSAGYWKTRFISETLYREKGQLQTIK